jgi:hypothetical protein
VRSPTVVASSSWLSGSIATQTHWGARSRRSMASAVLHVPSFTALSRANSSSSWTCRPRTSWRRYWEKARSWSAASTNHCSTVLGSTSNTRAAWRHGGAQRRHGGCLSRLHEGGASAVRPADAGIHTLRLRETSRRDMGEIRGDAGRGAGGKSGFIFPIFWYSEPMEPTSFELTPKQKGILATLSRETGKPISALLDEALEVLQEHERSSHDHGTGTTGGHKMAAPQLRRRKHPSRYGKSLKKPAETSPTKCLPAFLPVWPPKWITMSMACRSGSHAAFLCRYVLWDCSPLATR